MTERKKLKPRYVLYDKDGDKVGRISVGHIGQFPQLDVSDTELLTGVPAHQVNIRNVDVDKITKTQTDALSQSSARIDYDRINNKQTEEWSYKCPLLRKSVDDIPVNNTDDEMDSVRRVQWIDSNRAGGRDADPHIYISTLAKYRLQRFLPKWALEDLAHKVSLDGFAQIMTYELVQLERELIEAHPEVTVTDKDLYKHVADKYRVKYTAKEIEKLDNIVAEKIENNRDNITETMFGNEISLFDKYKKQWAQYMANQKTVKQVDWYSYSYSVEGPEFNSVEQAEEWINYIEDEFETQWEELLDKVRSGEVNINLTESITPRPVPAINNRAEKTVKSKNNTDHTFTVYREWWEADEIPELSMYCPHCGNKIYEDEGGNHTFDYSFNYECQECEIDLNLYNIITTIKSEYNKASISEERFSEVEFALKSYWNRAMRYGFRLGDRIAVDLRAYEFEQYADELDIDWDMKCPIYRKPIDSLDNEGLNDVEFNHIEYEDDDGNSRSQMAEGFTVSRSAHDVLHMNHPSWVWEYYMDNPVEQTEWQIYKLIDIEKDVYPSLYGEEVEPTDADLLEHIQKYYDLYHYSKEELKNIYTTISEKEEMVIDTYEETKDKCANKFAGKNDKGLDTQEKVAEFIAKKEERNEQYMNELQERADKNDIHLYDGDIIGRIHPLVKQYIK